MNTDQLSIVGTGLFFVVIFVSGYWLSRSGKPYNVIVLTIHKLISLAAAAFLVITIFQTYRGAALGAAGLIAGIVTGLFFVSTVVSGGLMSIDKPMPAAISMMHKLFPYLTVLSTAVTLYLLLSRR
jgi:hypothetical protein